MRKPITLQSLINKSRNEQQQSRQAQQQSGQTQQQSSQTEQHQNTQSEQHHNAETQQKQSNPGIQPTNETEKLSKDLNQNLSNLKSIYENCSDIVFRCFQTKGFGQAALIFFEGLSNIEEINNQVLAKLMNAAGEQGSSNQMTSASDWNHQAQNGTQELSQSPGRSSTDDHNQSANKAQSRSQSYAQTKSQPPFNPEKILSISSISNVNTLTDVIDQVSTGNPVLLIEQQDVGYGLGLAKWEKRPIEEPTAETVIRGPREGFIESSATNTALLRRKIRSPQFKTKKLEVGRLTKTEIIISYIEGVADPTLITEVENRISRIDTDGILESGYLEDYIEDDPYSPFPQVLNTERTDVVTSYLMEGHVAIITDGTPFALVVPTTFYSLMQSAEDYYQRPILSTMIRWLRFLFIVISLMLPSLYVAVLTYHHEMVPTSLLISMAASREPIPFPAIIEALSMEIMFEILREAGIRLPKQVGSAVSIVGALVIGQAAVEAGIVSAPMVMVVAVTGIASFAIPRYNAGFALRMLRFPMLLLAGFLGFLGIMLGVIVIVIHLCTLRSFGVPYLSPIAPMKGSEMKDVFMRLPRWAQDARPHLTRCVQ